MDNKIIDLIHTTTEKSNTLICYEFEQQIPTGFSTMNSMDFAYLVCLQELPDNVTMELIKVTSWNKTVLKIQGNDRQQLSAIKQSMDNKFKYVLYESIPTTNNTNHQSIHNAENHSEHKHDTKYQSQTTITPTNIQPNNDNNYTNSDNNNNDIDYSADEESGNDDYLSNKNITKRHKKSPKQLKQERQKRKHKKTIDNSNDNKPYKHGHKTPTQTQSESLNPSKSVSKSPNSNDSQREQKTSELQYVNAIIAPPPKPSDSEDNIPIPYNHQSPIIDNSPPKPHFNFQYNNNNNNNNNNENLNLQIKPEHKQFKESKIENNNMNRPHLPRFDFKNTGITYENISTSDDHSIDQHEHDPLFTNEHQLHPQPPVFNHIDFGKKHTFRYHKPHRNVYKKKKK
eukprot:496607_1